jgi:hypothetical protein
VGGGTFSSIVAPNGRFPFVGIPSVPAGHCELKGLRSTLLFSHRVPAERKRCTCDQSGNRTATVVDIGLWGFLVPGFRWVGAGGGERGPYVHSRTRSPGQLACGAVASALRFATDAAKTGCVEGIQAASKFPHPYAWPVSAERCMKSCCVIGPLCRGKAGAAPSGRG